MDILKKKDADKAKLDPIERKEDRLILLISDKREKFGIRNLES